MILWTFALVLAMGTLGASFMLQPPSGSIRTSRFGKDAGRHPASATLTIQELYEGGALSAAADLVLPCPKEGSNETAKSTFVEDVRQVRLSGMNCLKRDEIASTEVRNETNGFSATVFQPAPNSFTTDYITLAKGSNRIRILHIYKRGARIEREHIVERQNE